ncbi:MAG: hypothetical protein AB7O96_06810 [Pseudobdellovibrionaceae bacterium]
MIGLGHGFFRKTQLAENQPTIVWAVTGYVMPQPLEEYLENLYGVKIQFREIKSFQDFRTLFSTSDLVIAPLHWIESLQKEKLLRKLDDVILENASLAPEFAPFTVGDTTLPLFWDIYKYVAGAGTQKPDVLANSDLLWTWMNANQFKNSADWTEVNAWTPHISSVAAANFEKILALENLEEKDKESYAFLWMTAVTIPAHSIYKSLGTKLLFEISRKDLLLGWTSTHQTGTCFDHLKDPSIKKFYQPETIREISLARLLGVQKIPSSAESAMLEAFRHSRMVTEPKLEMKKKKN